MNSNQLSWNWVVRKWDGDKWPDKRISIGTDDGHAIFINARYAGDVTEQANIAAAAPDMYNALATAPDPSDLNFADPESEIRYRKWFDSNLAALAKADGETVMNDEQFFEQMYKDFDKTQNGECTSTAGAIVFYAIMIPVLIAVLFLA